MSRTLWFVAGAATSAYAITRARRVAEAFTPDGLRDRAAGLSLGARLVGDDVRREMAVRETDLRQRLGLGLDGATGTDAASTTPPLQLTRKASS